MTLNLPSRLVYTLFKHMLTLERFRVNILFILAPLRNWEFIPKKPLRYTVQTRDLEVKQELKFFKYLSHFSTAFREMKASLQKFRLDHCTISLRSSDWLGATT